MLLAVILKVTLRSSLYSLIPVIVIAGVYALPLYTLSLIGLIAAVVMLICSSGVIVFSIRYFGL